MLHPSNQAHEHNIERCNYDYSRTVQFETSRSSPFTIVTTPCTFPPLLHEKRSYWKRVGFGKFSSQPIRLSVLKLDGSTFDIIVTKKATVARLKQAVEAAFNHIPRQGDCMISWPHVWGHFCLCFEHMKLLRDRDPIARYGIKNGDQLQFVRNTPVYKIIAGETPVELTYNQDESEGSSSKSDLCRDMKNKQSLVKSEVNEGYRGFGASKKYRSNFVWTMRGLLSDRRYEGTTKRNYHVVRLGRPLPSDDAKSNERREVSRRLDMYPSGSFCDYVGGFGYPTGYCLK